MGQLDGKVVLVSGGASDIGRATALLLAAEGAAVAVGDVDLEGAESVAEEVRAAGGQATPGRCDVRDEDSVAAFVGRAVAPWKKDAAYCRNERSREDDDCASSKPRDRLKA